MTSANPHSRPHSAIGEVMMIVASLTASFCLTVNWPAGWPRWVLMWLIAVLTYTTCKALMWHRTTNTVPSSKLLTFLFLEPGLNAKTFFDTTRSPTPPSPIEWRLTFVSILLGLLLFTTIPAFLPSSWPAFQATSGLIGLVLSLHFGLLTLLSLGLRSRGYNSTGLMDHPLLATGIAEFWSDWNTGFRDFGREFIFYPLLRRRHSHVGMLLTFLFSGLIHDLVISLPAGGGYGLPTTYFLIQYTAILFERSRVGKSLRLSRGWTGRIWMYCVLVAPVSLLFHAPFRNNVVLPMLSDLGVLS